MSNERDITRDLEAWLADPAPPLDEHRLHQTIDRIPRVPQRRRWWPLRWFPLGIGATRRTDPARPRPKRRSTSMFTPTHIAAGVAVIALSGSLALIAGPLANPDVVPVPAAETEAPEAIPDGVHVNGTMRFKNISNPPPDYGVTIENLDGSSTYRDARFETEWDADDPRFIGEGAYTANSNTYPLDMSRAVTVGWGTQSLTTDEGGWTARPGEFGIILDDESVIPIWLDGDGAYEGLSALLIQHIRLHPNGGWFFDFEGWIVPGDAHFEDALE